MKVLKLIGISFIFFGCVSLSIGCNFFINNGALQLGVYGDGQADRSYLFSVLGIGSVFLVSGLLMFLVSKNSKSASDNKQQ